MSEMNEADAQTAAATAITLDTLDAIQLDALREVGNIGAGTAAASLSAMTGERVAMGVPSVNIIPIEQVPDQVGGDEALVVAVYLQVIGARPATSCSSSRPTSPRSCATR